MTARNAKNAKQKRQKQKQQKPKRKAKKESPRAKAARLAKLKARIESLKEIQAHYARELAQAEKDAEFLPEVREHVKRKRKKVRKIKGLFHVGAYTKKVRGKRRRYVGIYGTRSDGSHYLKASKPSREFSNVYLKKSSGSHIRDNFAEEAARSVLKTSGVQIFRVRVIGKFKGKRRILTSHLRFSKNEKGFKKLLAKATDSKKSKAIAKDQQMEYLGRRFVVTALKKVRSLSGSFSTYEQKSAQSISYDVGPRGKPLRQPLPIFKIDSFRIDALR